jgi:hypothetical protein
MLYRLEILSFEQKAGQVGVKGVMEGRSRLDYQTLMKSDDKTTAMK